MTTTTSAAAFSERNNRGIMLKLGAMTMSEIEESDAWQTGEGQIEVDRRTALGFEANEVLELRGDELWLVNGSVGGNVYHNCYETTDDLLMALAREHGKRSYDSRLTRMTAYLTGPNSNPDFKVQVYETGQAFGDFKHPLRVFNDEGREVVIHWQLDDRMECWRLDDRPDWFGPGPDDIPPISGNIRRAIEAMTVQQLRDIKSQLDDQAGTHEFLLLVRDNLEQRV